MIDSNVPGTGRKSWGCGAMTHLCYLQNRIMSLQRVPQLAKNIQYKLQGEHY